MDVVNSILQNDIQKKDTRKSTVVNKNTEIETDLGTLLALDYNALDLKTLKYIFLIIFILK